MRLLLATNHLGLGGTESYLTTVAEQLDRLAHEVLVYAPEPGAGVGPLRERGIATIADLERYEGEFDAALVQDGAVSHEVADRYPSLPQLYIAHSALFDLQAPPQVSGAVAMTVALNDRVLGRLRSYEVTSELLRLRQPIDTRRFDSVGPLPEKAQRVLLLSNADNDDRLGLVEGVCAELGMELSRLGGMQGQETDIRPAIAAADIVIGYGRSVLEAMSCGRAAYVYDRAGGDGWVTADSYPAIEATGFAGRVSEEVVDRERLLRDLAAYDPTMGPVNRDLVLNHHHADRHAEELIAAVGRLAAPEPRQRDGLAEMARLVRLEHRGQVELRQLREENAKLRHELNVRQAAHVEEIAALRSKVEAMESSSSWRLTGPLRVLSEKLSRRR